MGEHMKDFSIVRLKNVSLEMGERVLLNQLTFSLSSAEIVGLIGPPGAGKSLLLKVIAGLIPFTQGDVWVCGESLVGKNEAALVAHRQRLGMVFQNNALFDSLTVFDNVAFPLRVHGEVDDVEIRHCVEKRLTDVGLSHIGPLSIHELSGGMKKRVAIARATIHDPVLCLYDEPTAGLDPVTAAKIYALIKSFSMTHQATALIVSHELDTLFAVCDRVLMLHNGQLLFDGSPQHIGDAENRAVRQFARGSDIGPL